MEWKINQFRTVTLIVGVMFATFAQQGLAETCSAIKVTNSYLNVRSGPGTNYEKIGTMHSGEYYIATGKTSGAWKQVWFDGGKARWIYSQSYTSTAKVNCDVVSTAALNVRSGPGTHYRLVGTAPSGSHWAVIGSDGVWKKVWYASEARWIHSGYLGNGSSNTAIQLTGFNINKSAANTSSRFVTVYSTYSGSTPIMYRISEKSNFSGATWKAFENKITFTLSAGNGAKKVYFQLKNQQGRLSNVMSDSIAFKASSSAQGFNIKRKEFYNKFRATFGRLSQSQVDGINYLLVNMEKDTRPAIKNKTVWMRQIAYMFSTTKHEVANTYKPITEYGNENCRRYDGGCRYKGRGYVQLTHKYNYRKMSSIVGVDLVSNPTKALEPNIAYTVMSYGMFYGVFTGKKLGSYILAGKTDYVNARRVVNGLDKAQLLAGYARSFQKIMEASTVAR
ncbi:SH3 domain-containing protein [Zooshikella sp. RANM57]|uniref:SH3 domain-containing protein n=1 Tax=Zooshikella sp. RANM57 TaxID=3425863 RepID=UPI003D6E55F1